MAPTRYRPVRSLLWLSLLILLIGGLLTFILYTQNAHPQARLTMNVALTLTIVMSGLCVICATAQWWNTR